MNDSEFNARLRRWGLKFPLTTYTSGGEVTGYRELQGRDWYIPMCFHDAVMTIWEQEGEKSDYYETLDRAIRKDKQREIILKGFFMDMGEFSEPEEITPLGWDTFYQLLKYYYGSLLPYEDTFINMTLSYVDNAP